jgi:hypothetical protein
MASGSGSTNGFLRPSQPPSTMTPGAPQRGVSSQASYAPTDTGMGIEDPDTIRRRVTPAAGPFTLDPDPQTVTLLQHLMNYFDPGTGRGGGGGGGGMGGIF